MTIPEPPVPMPVEHRTRLLLGDTELLWAQTTPVHLEDWAIGFLYTEGFISAISDVTSLQVIDGEVRAEISSDHAATMDLAARRYLTSGCGKGVTFSSVKDAMMLRPVPPGQQVSQGQLLTWIRRMQAQSPLYAETGGMHAAGVVHIPTETLLVREDIGRHNAVDKALGAALKAGFPPPETVLLTTGRISYEMCSKVARYGAGVAASLTAATDQAIRLAGRVGVDLLGYVRKPERIVHYTQASRVIP